MRETIDDGIDQIKQAFENQSVKDHNDIRYDNQRYLNHSGSPMHEDALDANIMAAFSSATLESLSVAGAATPAETPRFWTAVPLKQGQDLPGLM